MSSSGISAGSGRVASHAACNTGSTWIVSGRFDHGLRAPLLVCCHVARSSSQRWPLNHVAGCGQNSPAWPFGEIAKAFTASMRVSNGVVLSAFRIDLSAEPFETCLGYEI